MHLGMSGRFIVRRAARTRDPGDFHDEAGGESAHDHVVFHLANGARVTYNDVRRFGFMDLVPRAELDARRISRTWASSRSATNSPARRSPTCSPARGRR